MTIVKRIVVTSVPRSCLWCDFCVWRGDDNCERVCVAGMRNRNGKECLTEEDVMKSRPLWCILEEQ